MSRRQDRVKYRPVERDQLLTARQVASYCQISLCTVYRPEIRSLGVHLGRRSLRWSLRALRAYLRPVAAGGPGPVDRRGCNQHRRPRTSGRNGPLEITRPSLPAAMATQAALALGEPTGPRIEPHTVCAPSRRLKKRKGDRAMMRDKRDLVPGKGR